MAVNRHRRWAPAALALLAWGPGCTHYRALPGAPPTRWRADAVVSSGAPFRLVPRPPDGEPLGAGCRAMLVAGTARGAAGDTVWFSHVTRVESAVPKDRGCPGAGSAAVVIFDAGTTRDFDERRMNWRRTALLLVGLSALYLAVAAYAANHMTFDAPPDR